MKSIFKTVIVSVLLLTPFSSKTWAEEIPTPPEQPVVENMDVDEANNLIEQYNSAAEEYNAAADTYNEQVDIDYQKDVEDYNKQVQEVAEHNAEEDKKVAEATEHNAQENKKVEENKQELEEYQQKYAEYEQELSDAQAHNKQEDEKVAEVEAHNTEENEKLAKSQEELAIIDAKIEADAPGTIIENFTESANELPDSWDDTSEELHTIKVEEAEEKSGENVKIINLHLYLDGEYAPAKIVDNTKLTNNHFELTQEVKDNLLFAEWEVATFDLNDRVTVSGEGELYKNDTIRHDGKNYRIQAYDARHVRNVEDHTQGAWTPGSMVEYNCNTSEYGWGYDFDTMEGKGGETYTFEFNEVERTQSYLYNGKVMTETVKERTIDGTEPKNILSIFTYLFQKIWSEPVEYTPDYQDYTPNYKEEPQAPEKVEEYTPNYVEYTPEYLNDPEEPIKKDYLEKIELMDLLEKPAPEPTPEPTPEPVPVNPEPIPSEPEPTPQPPTPTPVEPEPTPVPLVEETVIAEPVVEEIIEGGVPAAEPIIKSWALLNLISTILSVIIALLMLITFLKKEKHYDEDGEEEYKRLYAKLSGILPAILSVILFIMTEDMRNPMVFIDKWTLPMLIILLISIVLSYITKRKDEDKDDENTPS